MMMNLSCQKSICLNLRTSSRPVLAQNKAICLNLRTSSSPVSVASRPVSVASSRPTFSVAPRRHVAVRAASSEVVSVTGEEEISTKDVQKLLSTLTQPDMSIAELHLEMGDLEIRVRRSVEADTPAVPAAAVLAAAPTMDSIATIIAPPPSMSPALHLAPAPYASVDDYSPEDTIDESLMYVTANRVGVFRRGKSKCKVGDQVKKGQVLGAIEQLGTIVDVKSPQEGEIVAYKVSEGDPVEYGGAIVCLAPYFGMEDAGKTQLRGIQ